MSAVTDEVEELSFEDKLNRGYHLALEIIYEDDHCTRKRDWSLSRELEDEAHEWADGLVHKYHYKRIEGRCSLTDSLVYDPAVEEQRADEAIARFEAVLKQHGVEIP
jgi:hypothetical protein